jgi:gas vesicle protein
MSSDNESYRIDNSDDLSFRDSLSKKRVAFGKQRRTLRQEKKDLRKSYKEILNQVNNSADRRKLKDEYQSAIKDVDTRLNNLTDKNKQGIDNDVHSGIDSIQSDTDPLEAAYASQDFYLYAFKVIDDLDGTVSVLTGTVNTVTATGLEPAGQPDELWLKVTFDTDGVVTAASVEDKLWNNLRNRGLQADSIHYLGRGCTYYCTGNQGKSKHCKLRGNTPMGDTI